jgi:hypothetical protein
MALLSFASTPPIRLRCMLPGYSISTAVICVSTSVVYLNFWSITTAARNSNPSFALLLALLDVDSRKGPGGAGVPYVRTRVCGEITL